jgi:hypothetical protein
MASPSGSPGPARPRPRARSSACTQTLQQELLNVHNPFTTIEDAQSACPADQVDVPPASGPDLAPESDAESQLTAQAVEVDRVDRRDIARLTASGATPAGPPPLPPPLGSVIELERTVSAAGNISISDQVIGAGLPLAGQRVTLRLEGPVAHVLAGGVLVRTVAWPVPEQRRPRLRGARSGTASPPQLPGPQQVRRRVSARAPSWLAGSASRWACPMPARPRTSRSKPVLTRSPSATASPSRLRAGQAVRSGVTKPRTMPRAARQKAQDVQHDGHRC